MKTYTFSIVLLIGIICSIGCTSTQKEQELDQETRLVYDSVFVWERKAWSPIQVLMTSYNDMGQVSKVSEKMFLLNNRRQYPRIQEKRGMSYNMHLYLTGEPVPDEGIWAPYSFMEYSYNDQDQVEETQERFHETGKVTDFVKSVIYSYDKRNQPSSTLSRNKSHPDSLWTIVSKDSIIYDEDGLKKEKYTIYGSNTKPGYWYSYYNDSTLENTCIKRRYDRSNDSWNTFETEVHQFQRGRFFLIETWGYKSNEVFQPRYFIEKRLDENGLVNYEETSTFQFDAVQTRLRSKLTEYIHDDQGNTTLKTHSTWVNGIWVKQLQERFSYESCED